MPGSARWFPISSHLVTDQNPYTPPPPRTQEDIEALVAFIQARVKPLRDSAAYDSDEYRAFQALLDLAVYVKGVAQGEVGRGEEPYLEFHYLAVAARNWDGHPDFQAHWTP